MAETEHYELVLLEVLRHLHQVPTQHKTNAVGIHEGTVWGAREVIVAEVYVEEPQTDDGQLLVLFGLLEVI